MLLDSRNWLRVKYKQILEYSHFDNIVIVAIFISTINLSIDSPLNDPASTLSLVTWSIDIAMTAVFTLEAVIKIVVLGFVFNGAKSYLRSWWSVIDFLTVVTSLVSYIGSTDESGLSFFKIFRVVRFLRPLRII